MLNGELLSRWALEQADQHPWDHPISWYTFSVTAELTGDRQVTVTKRPWLHGENDPRMLELLSTRRPSSSTFGLLLVARGTRVAPGAVPFRQLVVTGVLADTTSVEVLVA